MVALWPSLRTALSVARPKTLATLNVLTFNVFCGPPTPTALCGALEGSKRLRLQAERIRDLAPDIVCLQEVQSDGVRQAFERMLPEYDSHYILTDDELRCRIGKVMRRALDAAGAGPQTTISGFLLGPVRSGLMILHRRDTLVADGVPRAITFSEQSGDMLNAFRPRGALCAPLRLRADGSRVAVVNTHTNAESADAVGGVLFGRDLPSVPLPSTPRRRQLTELFSFARRLSRHSRVVVCGDLNSAPELGEIPADEHGFVDVTSATAEKRRRAAGLEDRVDGTALSCQRWLATWDGTRNPLVSSGWHSEGSSAKTQLDYIFSSDASGLAPQEVTLALDDGPSPLSDHFGLSARFAVGDFRPPASSAHAQHDLVEEGHPHIGRPEAPFHEEAPMPQQDLLEPQWGI